MLLPAMGVSGSSGILFEKEKIHQPDSLEGARPEAIEEGGIKIAQNSVVPDGFQAGKEGIFLQVRNGFSVVHAAEDDDVRRM